MLKRNGQRRSAEDYRFDCWREASQSVADAAGDRQIALDTATRAALGAGRTAEELDAAAGPALAPLRALQRLGAESGGGAVASEWLDDELDVLRQELPDYEVLERVRYGGQGVVYRARQRGTNRPVALKLLVDGPLATPRQKVRFTREIELVGRLRHPHIVTVYECGAARGRSFYAMEFVEGEAIDTYATLADLDARQVVALLLKVCRAVQHAHQNGVIHRDLNPANILVDSKGEPRVFDFGLAKDLWAVEGGEALTSVGCGTFPYLSPEQIGAGDGSVDVRTDVYATGLVLYELLTDLFPYPVQGSPTQVRQAIVTTEPLPLRRALALGDPDWAPGRAVIDADLEAVLAKALAKRKEDRYQSAAGLADDLENWLAGRPVLAQGDSTVYVLKKMVRRHRWAVATAAALLAIAVTLATAVTHFWLVARTERDTARKTITELVDHIESVLGKIDDDVEPLPGGLAVSEALVAQLDNRIDRALRLAGQDESLQPVRARLIEKHGDLAAAHGDRARALQHYRDFLARSIELYRTGQESRPDHGASQVLRAYRKVGTALDDPQETYAQGLAFAEPLTRRDPVPDAVRLSYAQLCAEFAEWLRQHGRASASVQYCEAGLALIPCAPEYGRDQDYLLEDWRRRGVRARLLGGEGQAADSLGDSRSASVLLAEAQRLREELVAERRADVVLRLALGQSYAAAAEIARHSGDTAEAQRLLKKGSEHADILATIDPDSALYDKRRYLLHYWLAWTHLDLKDFEAAEADLEKAQALSDVIWNRDPNDPDAMKHAAFTFVLRGKRDRKFARYGTAVEDYVAAAQLLGPLAIKPRPTIEQLTAFASACDGVVVAEQERLGADLPCPTGADFEVALDWADLALAFHGRAISLDPTNVLNELNYFKIRYNQARVRLATQDPQYLPEVARSIAEMDGRLRELDEAGLLETNEFLTSYLRVRVERLTAGFVRALE